MEPPPKLCPRCGEEYLHTVQLCAHCGVELVLEGALAPPVARDSEGDGESLPPTADLVSLRAADARWISGLAEALAEAGIPSRVERHLPPGQGAEPEVGDVRVALYVRSEDAEVAARIDAEFMRAQVPDAPENGVVGWTESEGCPACGVPLMAGAEECPECGLVFAPAEEG